MNNSEIKNTEGNDKSTGSDNDNGISNGYMPTDDVIPTSKSDLLFLKDQNMEFANNENKRGTAPAKVNRISKQASKMDKKQEMSNAELMKMMGPIGGFGLSSEYSKKETSGNTISDEEFNPNPYAFVATAVFVIYMVLSNIIYVRTKNYFETPPGL